MDRHNVLHPPMNVKNLKNKDEALLIIGSTNGIFMVAFLNAYFEVLPKAMDVPVNDFSNFLNSPDCRSLKAVIFNLVNLDNMSAPVNLEIRQMVNEEVRKRKWHLNMVSSKAFSNMSTLFASKIDSKPGDVILNVVSMDQMIAVFEFRRKQEGYSYIGDRLINRYNKNVNDVATEILGTCNPKYVNVVDLHWNDLIMSLKSRVVSSKNVISIDSEAESEYTQHVLKAIFDHGNNQIIPFSMDVLAITNDTNFTALEQAAIVVDGYEDLTLEKDQIVPKSKKPYYVVFLDRISGIYKRIGEAQLSKEPHGHRTKLALVIDRNSLPFLYQEPFNLAEIEELPKNLSSSNADLNVPVIGFFDNSSVICVHNENGYTFLNEWNGLYGNDLYLSFEQKEPTLITDLNKVKNKDPFLVYDLVKVLSLPAEDLKVDPKWGFKVIASDSEHSVLLQFETFLGTRKSSTPIFMMALLLKHHIKAIKKETGKKPKELGFCFFNEFTNEEKKRILDGLKEACKLLKIDFVFVTNI